VTVFADYRALTKADFIASSIGGFGFWSAHKIRLTRRALKRLFWLGFGGAKYFDLHVATSRDEAERAAVAVTICYYSSFGRKLSEKKQFLFADTMADLDVQRVWLRSERRAVFAQVAITRLGADPCIGLEGRLKLSAQGELKLHPRDVATSRDRAALEHTLTLAVEDNDRTYGRALLARLIYLWQGEVHVRDLQVLADADLLVAHGMRLDHAKKRDGLRGSGTFLYEGFCNGFLPDRVPLSKWLRLEIALLNAAVLAAKVETIEIGLGSHSEVRAVAASIVAKQLGLRLQVSEGSSRLGLGWLSASELKALRA